MEKGPQSSRLASDLNRKRQKNRRNKVVIEFDEKKRTEYLTGFSKRKNERKKKAKEEEIALLKQKKKALKVQKGSEKMDHIESVRSALADMERQTTVKETTHVYGQKHTVTVTELDLHNGTVDRLGENVGEELGDSDIESDANQHPQSHISGAKYSKFESGKKLKSLSKKDANVRRKKPHVSYTHAHHRRKKLTTETRRQLKKTLKRKAHQHGGGR